MTTTTKTKKEKVVTLSDLMEATIFNIKGQETGKINLPEQIFGLPWNADLVHQVVVSMQANERGSTAHTKDRGEVRGGGKKPWQQQGTGRARHGSSRSPIWKGGGVTHGPRHEKIYAKKINRQMKQKALLLALSRKYKDGQIIFVDTIEMSAPKAKEAKAMLTALGRAGFTAKKKNAALIALPNAHKPTIKSFSNFNNINVTEVRNLNPISVLGSKYLVIADPKSAFEMLSKKRVALRQAQGK
ncbi:MAG: 50S ribosomal protein L4 [bacterium]|nr:50S ribosomal protein L4 [bacterium]